MLLPKLKKKCVFSPVNNAVLIWSAFVLSCPLQQARRPFAKGHLVQRPLGTKFLTKEAQIFGEFRAILKSFNFAIKTYLATSCAEFREIGLLFIPTSGHTGRNLLKV